MLSHKAAYAACLPYAHRRRNPLADLHAVIAWRLAALTFTMMLRMLKSRPVRNGLIRQPSVTGLRINDPLIVRHVRSEK